MARAQSGGYFFSKGKHWGRFYVDRTRPKHRIAIPIACATSKEEAQERIRVMLESCAGMKAAGQNEDAVTALLRQMAAAPKDSRRVTQLRTSVKLIEKGLAYAPQKFHPGLTMQQLIELWCNNSIHHEFPKLVKACQPEYAKSNLGRARKWIYPHVADVAVSAFTRAHADIVMRHCTAPSDGSKRHVAQIMHRALEIAQSAMGLIEKNPLPENYLPKVEDRKARSYIFPQEDAKLLGCTMVHIAYRVLWGFLAREGMRSVSEALKLEWTDMQLELGDDKGYLNLDKNKTNDPRSWKLREDTVRALRLWRRYQGPDAPLFVFTHPTESIATSPAKKFRAHLKLAGVQRPELYANTDSRKNVVVHDLRATFVTTALRTEKGDMWIRDRTGHTTLRQMEAYRRWARMAEELEMPDLSPLDQAIPELRQLAAQLAAERSNVIPLRVAK